MGVFDQPTAHGNRKWVSSQQALKLAVDRHLCGAVPVGRGRVNGSSMPCQRRSDRGQSTGKTFEEQIGA